jgi:hypothetical protein
MQEDKSYLNTHSPDWNSCSPSPTFDPPPTFTLQFTESHPPPTVQPFLSCSHAIAFVHIVPTTRLCRWPIIAGFLHTEYNPKK